MEARKRILIVDDEEHVRLLHSEELREAGYITSTRDSGYKLIETIVQESPDLVVLDIKMVDYDGLDLLQDVKQQFPELPVILCTAYDTFKEDIKSIAADYYVVKSFDVSELKTKIKMALESHVPGTSQLTCGMALKAIHEGIKRMLQGYEGNLPMPKDHHRYQSMLKEFEQKSLLSFCEREEIDALAASTSRDMAREIRRVKKLVRQRIILQRSNDFAGGLKDLYDEMAPPLSILSPERFEQEVRRAMEEVETDIQILNHQIDRLRENIQTKQFRSIPIDTLKAALAIRSRPAPNGLDIADIIMSEIRHDLKNKLAELFQQIKSLKEDMEACPTENIRRLVRDTQRREGYESCFGDYLTKSCKQDSCTWKSDCIRAAGGHAAAVHLQELSKTHLQLLSIMDRIYDISSFRVVPFYKTIGIKSFLESITASLRLDLSRTHVEIICECDHPVMTDPNLIGVAIRQLLNNSVEAIEPSREDGLIRILVSTDVAAKAMSIVIKDNGHGIPKDLMERILQPGVRYKKSEHSGMGLPLAFFAASAIDGKIELESEANAGTKATVTIPWEV